MPQKGKAVLRRTNPADGAERLGPDDYVQKLPVAELPELIRPIIVARSLGISRQTVYNLVATGELAAIRVGTGGMRIFRQSLLDYLRRQLA